MTSSDAHPQLKAKKRPHFCSSQKSEIPGEIGGVLVPAPAFCLLSSPFTLLNEHRCLEDTREGVIKTVGHWTVLGGSTGPTSPLPTPQTRNTLLAPK